MFCLKIDTVNPLLSPQGGLLIMFKGGLNRDGGLFERGGLLNSAKTMVSVLH